MEGNTSPILQKKRKPLDLVELTPASPKSIYCQKTIKIMGIMGKDNTVFFTSAVKALHFILCPLAFFLLKPREKNSASHREKKNKKNRSLFTHSKLSLGDALTVWQQYCDYLGLGIFLKKFPPNFLLLSVFLLPLSLLITGVIIIMLSSATVITHLCIFLDLGAFFSITSCTLRDLSLGQAAFWRL